jgi:hypothetical protein
MTIKARYVRCARKGYRCDCGTYIAAGHGYLYLYGDADDHTAPFAVRVCRTCIEADLLPAVQERRGWAWKETRVRDALAQLEARHVTP